MDGITLWIIGFAAGWGSGVFIGMAVLAACQLSSWITHNEENNK